jgi:ribosomal protein S1
MGTVRVGDIVSGVVAAVTLQGAQIVLDGDLTGFIGGQDTSWGSPRTVLRAGDRVTAEVVDADDPGHLRLSRSATENPQLWAFLKDLRPGQLLSGTVAAIERFGVFVALDDGPAHPVFPGVGLVTLPELSWRRFADPLDVVTPGQRITCEFLAFDTLHGEARLSLRGTQPDPFRRFADRAHVGQVLRGPVTTLTPFGAFVRVADGVEGLIRSARPDGTPELRVGDEVTVTIVEIDRPRRRVTLAYHA